MDFKSLLILSSKFVRCHLATFIVTCIFCIAIAAWAGENEGLRPFTVKDSIEISYIMNPAASTAIELREAQPIGVPINSPDGKYFLLITQRGVLSTKNLEATIWLFDRRAVRDYVSKKSATKPASKVVATLSARSNTPVISSVRWLEDSNRIAFLGMKDSPYQQLFIADLSAGSLTGVTKHNVYVSAYDISGDTIAYSTLITPGDIQDSSDDLVDVTGTSIESLLYPKPPRIEDLEEGALQTYPSTLHVQRSGHELSISFTMGGKPLRLFIPTLSLSPDGRSLITVAPVHEIPPYWGEYQPAFPGMDFILLKPGNSYALADENPWKASQYVLIDLQTGRISPLVDAPAGRGLVYYFAPTKAFWFADSRRAILSNTLLPIDSTTDESERTQRSHTSSVAMVDISRHKIQRVTYLVQPRLEAGTAMLTDVSWNEAEKKVTLSYSSPTSSSIPPSESYGLKSGEWVKIPTPTLGPGGESGRELELSVDQDLNHPPFLSGHLSGSATASNVWDPNPQLERLSLGKASLYHWQDTNGNSRSGILALPPNYDPKLQYPLVIQTHGYDGKRFFADGEYTTGSGGRALVAKGIVVLQIDDQTNHYNTPNEGPDQIAGFESAISGLSKAGLVDPRRVGVIGFSRTCFHVLYAITHRPDLFAAASITDGVNMSYVRYIMDTEPGYQELFEKTNGGIPFGKGLMNWAQNAPGFNLDMIQAPLLISAFERLQLIYEWEFYSGLRRLNKPVDMIWLRKENAPHILVEPYHRYVSQQAAVDWFDFWLKGEEDPDPAKAEQYARWRELRKLHVPSENTSSAK